MFAEDEEPSLSVTRLADEFSDPLTTLPQLLLQDAYMPSNYGIDASTNRVIARLIEHGQGPPTRLAHMR